MARQTSLLDFAIVATLAILPVMLGIVLLVALVRPADPGTVSWRGAPERYVSVRQVAALKTFERAIVERPAVALPAPTAQEVLDALPQCRAEWGAPGARWGAGAWLARLPFVPRQALAAPADHVAAQLAALDAALLRFATRPNPRVAQPLGLDARRWLVEAGRSLDNPIESTEYPGRRFQLHCTDLAAALAALLDGEGRILEAFTWRGSAAPTLLAHWRADQQVEIAAQHVARRNPWSGIAGCIFLGRREAGGEGMGPSYVVAAPRSAQRRLCDHVATAGVPRSSAAAAAGAAPAVQVLAGEPRPADAVDDTRWMVPPSLATLLQPLEALRLPTGTLYQAYGGRDESGTPAPVVLDGSPVEMGLSIDLTIDPDLQGLAQRTAACYTGRHEVCRALGLRRRDDKDQPLGSQLLEGAMVRMAAVAVVDVASGRIEALAGALSRCARQEVDGPGRDVSCDARLPYPLQYRADALLNPAVFHDAMPASTIKPIMAAAFLSDPEVGERWMAAERAAMPSDAAPARRSLRSQLLRSDSARFLDRMFCLDQDALSCDRPWAVQAMAPAFGWNAGCSGAGPAGSRADCGKHELLFGAPIDASPGRAVALPRPRPMTVAYGRLMSQPREGKLGAPMQLMPPMRLDPGIVRRCASGADGRRSSDDDWEKCRGGAVVDVVAEGWGQGHARASALGIAGMMATLAAAANGQDAVQRPHLVEGVRSVDATVPPALAAALAQWREGARQPNRLSTGAADLILNALGYSHRIGTARSACEQVFDPARCRGIGWLAGKTGTPSFPHDGTTLDELARLCPQGVAAAGAKPGSCSSLRPYKWYVAAYRTDQGSTGPWNKVIAVLTERNWVQRTGQVHGSGDHGPNPAAEIAMQITGRQLGLLTTGAAP